jgi:hypothetical protein
MPLVEALGLNSELKVGVDANATVQKRKKAIRNKIEA